MLTDVKDIENYLFFDLSRKEVLALFSEWIIKMDTYSIWQSTYIEIEKTHMEKVIKEGYTNWIQKYSLIVIASKRKLTKKELVKHLTDIKLDTINIGNKKQ